MNEISVRLFGSAARGESDELSDLDILIISDRPYSKEERESSLALLLPVIQVRFPDAQLNGKISPSWYGKNRFAQMHAEGHLFAWHIFRESKKLLSDEKDFVDLLDVPGKYVNLAKDIERFHRIMLEGRRELESCPRNAPYEAGMLYLCCRNIAMCASWCSSAGLKFGRYSPYEIEDLASFGFAKEVYSRFLRARIDPARKGRSGPVFADEVFDAIQHALGWYDEIVEKIAEKEL